MSDQGTAATVEREPGLATVVAASAAGTAFEWYDFFVFGSLATVIAKHFYTGVNEATGFILALATFAVGFFVRPLGALVFGIFGDLNGRKNAFLVTITAMGLATVAIGLLPDYGAIGMAAPIGLIVLRMIQGFALGGEYGGAAIYVAEHAPAKSRGFLTSFIQTSAALGLIGALLVILACRTWMGKEAFEDGWGWRIPFVLSALLLLISLWIRMKLGESPAFKRMAEESKHHPRAPFRETFFKWKNLKLVLLVLFGVMIAQGAVWYCAFFYSQFFMQKILKLDEGVVLQLMVGATAASAFLYVFFGWLSDKIGRKPVMLFGMVLAVVAFFPTFNSRPSRARR
jgi:MFS family permease